MVEGKGEKYLYPKWINLINPGVAFIQDHTLLDENLIYIIGGAGYPGYFNMIRNAALDIQNLEYKPLLVISIDCENMEYSEKEQEIEDLISTTGLSNEDYVLILQDYCLETWALGNRLIIKRNPQTKDLKEFISFYDVTKLDPAKMPSITSEMNRAQFSSCYLAKALRDRGYNLAYRKARPTTLEHPKYFHSLVKRCKEGDIESFSAFLRTFEEIK